MQEKIIFNIIRFEFITSVFILLSVDKSNKMRLCFLLLMLLYIQIELMWFSSIFTLAISVLRLFLKLLLEKLFI